MDPNAALKDARALALKIVQDDDAGKVSREDAVEMANLFDAIDGWIMRGGFLPEVWQQSAGAAPIAGADANGERTYAETVTAVWNANREL